MISHGNKCKGRRLSSLLLLALTWHCIQADSDLTSDSVDARAHLRTSSQEDQRNTNNNGGSPLSWEDLDKIPLASWYDEAKFGIFIHWGVFSVPGLCSEWFGSYWQDKWGPCPYVANALNQTERSNVAYSEFASRFHAELYNATDWSHIFAKAGAQYVVLTSKHHEGYCMWNSTSVAATWQWNVMDVGPRRDLLGELASAVKLSKSSHTGKPIKFGVYHSLYEWFNPLYQQDKASNFTTDYFVKLKTMAELRDLVEKYEPEVIWSDGDWEAHSDYWQAREFLTWYATKVKTGIWNDRWGTDTTCKHGSFLTCADRYTPGHLVPKKWENAMTIDQTSWGWNRASPLENYLSVKELVHTLIETVAFNGNLLLNVGPSGDGTISPIFVDRLMGIGDWLKVNGPAIYSTRPWSVCQRENTTGVYYTRTQHLLYVHVTKWPEDSKLHIACPVPTADTTITLLGYDDDVTAAATRSRSSWSTLTKESVAEGQAGMTITMPAVTPNTIPCQNAWVLQLTNIGNLDDSQVMDK